MSGIDGRSRQESTCAWLGVGTLPVSLVKNSCGRSRSDPFFRLT